MEGSTGSATVYDDFWKERALLPHLKDVNYLGLIQMACALLWFRRLHRMGRCDATQNAT